DAFTPRALHCAHGCDTRVRAALAPGAQSRHQAGRSFVTGTPNQGDVGKAFSTSPQWRCRWCTEFSRDPVTPLKNSLICPVTGQGVPVRTRAVCSIVPLGLDAEQGTRRVTVGSLEWHAFPATELSEARSTKS